MNSITAHTQVPRTDSGTAPVTMRGVVQQRYGSADALHVQSIARPTIADNEVLVQVHAAGLSRATWHLMTGKPYLMRLGLGLRGPKSTVIGQDLAGTIVEVGSAVRAFSIGDEVFGIGSGSFAEYVAAAEGKLARKPSNITFAQAAVIPVCGLTALQGLRDAGHVEAGQNVLITGAAGGVGSFAVQLAKAFRATVTAVCGTAKVDLVRSLGADHVVDYTRTDFADAAQRYDLILDIAGNPTLARLRRALTLTGTAVIAGGEHGGNLTGMSRQLRAVAVSPFIRQRLAMLMCVQCGSDLEQLADLVEQDTITPSVDRSFPLEKVADAMRYLESGQVRGKIAVTI
ncbi:NAD(P)-dependent alcohol dehydrogenase [Rathayibacter soli]|uniref:NAD(P)-dependent alcohol dehydrogenase n=1 Tax=Rathayibacter soli TaxID=3144168 RepID=UPI0027E52FFE|nr:NAD(P)-dependent alcohol dehydrogenase [Glaciibacter superstes]